MSPGANQVTKRLDRVLRAQLAGGVLLALGAAAFLLGIGLLLLTIRYTPDQLSTIMAARPWTHDVFLWLPVAEHHRLLGAAIVLAGIVLLALGNIVRDDQWWY